MSCCRWLERSGLAASLSPDSRRATVHCRWTDTVGWAHISGGGSARLWRKSFEDRHVKAAVVCGLQITTTTHGGMDQHRCNKTT